MKNFGFILFLFYINLGFSQVDSITVSESAEFIFEEKSPSLAIQKLEITDNEILRILESAIADGHFPTKQNSFCMFVQSEKQGFKASFSQVEDFDLFPEKTTDLQGFVLYNNTYFFIFGENIRFFKPTG